MCAESPHNLCVTTKKMNQDFNGIVGKTDPCVHEFVCLPDQSAADRTESSEPVQRDLTLGTGRHISVLARKGGLVSVSRKRLSTPMFSLKHTHTHSCSLSDISISAQ